MSENSNLANCRKSFLKEGVVVVKSLPTLVMTCGEWIHEQKPTDENAGLLIILFPGNPGVITFYEDFMCTLYENLRRSIPIWGVSHVGHTSMKSDDILPNISGNEEIYDLEGQILHKMAFITKFVPQDRKLIFIAHSIGCFITLELMKRYKNLKVEHAYLLFPTIERMTMTPNGRWMNKALPYLHVPVLLVVYSFGFLCESMQRKIISWFLGRDNLPECAITACLKFCTTFCVRASYLLTRDEFKYVLEPDVNTISKNIEKITFYYGSLDKWCPVSYYEHMKEIFPQGDIKLCTRNLEHAFVLESTGNEEMAEMLATWISNKF